MSATSATALNSPVGTLHPSRGRAAVVAGLLDSNAILLTAIGLVAAYAPPLTQSFWGDEAGTYWMACRGPIAAIHRTAHWPGQSILFAVITSFFCFDGSPLRDVLLRVPALVGAAAAAYFLYRFAEDLFGAGAGRIAALLFAFSPTTIEFATQARPYTLAMAAAAASCWTLHRWVQTRARGWLAGYVAASALIVYFHYLFGVIFIAQAVFLIYEFILERRLSRVLEFLAACAIVVLLATGLIGPLRLLVHESHTLPFTPKPSASELGAILMPPLYAVTLLASALLIGPIRRGGACPARLSPSAKSMLLVWWLAGPILLFAASSTTPMRMFAARYVSYSGLALVLLLTFAGVSIFGSRTGFTWALVLVGLTTIGNVFALAGPHQPSLEELGPFMRVIRDESASADRPPVLFQSTLVESNFYDWRAGNSPESYLLAPFAAYPVKNELLPLPYALTDDVKAHVQHLLQTDLKNRRKVILVPHDVLWIHWFVERFQEAGFTYRFVRPNAWWVIVFERPGRVGLEATGAPQP